ncbi:MAG: hypothetical protein EAZ85_14445 [Bacteroidetes bacterium]|nr:MAG: hypothetical protein EAZ85_14445 [Bacteroidota bacterium]TAG86383.1 MAG: hypothetical protein EAZ20_12895 [Bacteroidota bacterium]
MLKNLPIYIPIIFGMITFVVLFLFYNAIKNTKTEKISKKSNIILFFLIFWLIIQAVLSYNNVYNSHLELLPPKIMIFGVLPTILVMIFLFVTKSGLEFIDSVPIINLTYINIVRIFVEIALFLLFTHKAIPQIMTFEGRNFDIIAGITAPLIIYFGFQKGKLNHKIILYWNFICLLLLLNIVFYAIFSAPSPFQQFGFEQPNVAILHFPFAWLPTFIVPVVLFGHFVSIRQLLKQK